MVTDLQASNAHIIASVNCGKVLMANKDSLIVPLEILSLFDFLQV